MIAEMIASIEKHDMDIMSMLCEDNDISDQDREEHFRAAAIPRAQPAARVKQQSRVDKDKKSDTADKSVKVSVDARNCRHISLVMKSELCSSYLETYHITRAKLDTVIVIEKIDKYKKATGLFR